MVEASAPNIECLGVHCFVYFLPFPSSTLVARQPLWAKFDLGLQQPDISLKTRHYAWEKYLTPFKNKAPHFNETGYPTREEREGELSKRCARDAYIGPCSTQLLVWVSDGTTAENSWLCRHAAQYQFRTPDNPSEFTAEQVDPVWLQCAATRLNINCEPHLVWGQKSAREFQPGGMASSLILDRIFGPLCCSKSCLASDLKQNRVFLAFGFKRNHFVSVRIPSLAF